MDKYKKRVDGFWVHRDPLRLLKDEREWITVQGREITIEGYEEFDLFAHRTVNMDDEWTVSEGISGLAVMMMGETFSDVVDMAESILKEKVNVEKFKTLINEAVEKHGLSPRYKLNTPPPTS